MTERTFIVIKNVTIDINHIISIKKTESFENCIGEYGRFVYSLIINETENKYLPYANTKIDFLNLKKRTKAYKNLISILKSEGATVINNKNGINTRTTVETI